MKGRFDNTSDTGNSAVSSTILLQFHKPQLGIGCLDGVDPAVAEIFLVDQIQYEIVANFCGMSDTLLQCHIAFHQFDDVDIALAIVDAGIDFPLDIFFQFAKFFQVFCVECSSFSRHIGVTVLVGKVFSLALSCPKETPFMIFAFSGHCQTPFRNGKSLD